VDGDVSQSRSMRVYIARQWSKWVEVCE